MNPQPARHLILKPDVVLVFGWLLIGILLYVFWPDLNGIIWFLAECARFIYWLSGVSLVLMLFADLLRRIRHAEFRMGNLLPVFMLVTGSAILWQLGPHYGFLVRFWLNKPRYEQMVKQLQETPSSKYEEQDSYFYEGYIVDTGPTLRVAFDLGSGLLNRFQVIVYDPTGFVMQARPLREKSKRDSGDPQSVEEPFWGYAYGCEPIEHIWYYCHFD